MARGIEISQRVDDRSQSRRIQDLITVEQIRSVVRVAGRPVVETTVYQEIYTSTKRRSYPVAETGTPHARQVELGQWRQINSDQRGDLSSSIALSESDSEAPRVSARTIVLPTLRDAPVVRTSVINDSIVETSRHQPDFVKVLRPPRAAMITMAAPPIQPEFCPRQQTVELSRPCTQERLGLGIADACSQLKSWCSGLAGSDDLTALESCLEQSNSSDIEELASGDRPSRDPSRLVSAMTHFSDPFRRDPLHQSNPLPNQGGAARPVVAIERTCKKTYEPFLGRKHMDRETYTPNAAVHPRSFRNLAEPISGTSQAATETISDRAAKLKPHNDLWSHALTTFSCDPPLELAASPEEQLPQIQPPGRKHWLHFAKTGGLPTDTQRPTAKSPKSPVENQHTKMQQSPQQQQQLKSPPLTRSLCADFQIKPQPPGAQHWKMFSPTFKFPSNLVGSPRTTPTPSVSGDEQPTPLQTRETNDRVCVDQPILAHMQEPALIPDDTGERDPSEPPQGASLSSTDEFIESTSLLLSSCPDDSSPPLHKSDTNWLPEHTASDNESLLSAVKRTNASCPSKCSNRWSIPSVATLSSECARVQISQDTKAGLEPSVSPIGESVHSNTCSIHPHSIVTADMMSQSSMEDWEDWDVVDSHPLEISSRPNGDSEPEAGDLNADDIHTLGESIEIAPLIKAESVDVGPKSRLSADSLSEDSGELINDVHSTVRRSRCASAQNVKTPISNSSSDDDVLSVSGNGDAPSSSLTSGEFLKSESDVPINDLHSLSSIAKSHMSSLNVLDNSTPLSSSQPLESELPASSVDEPVVGHASPLYSTVSGELTTGSGGCKNDASTSEVEVPRSTAEAIGDAGGDLAETFEDSNAEGLSRLSSGKPTSSNRKKAFGIKKIFRDLFGARRQISQVADPQSDEILPLSSEMPCPEDVTVPADNMDRAIDDSIGVQRQSKVFVDSLVGPQPTCKVVNDQSSPVRAIPLGESKPSAPAEENVQTCAKNVDEPINKPDDSAEPIVTAEHKLSQAKSFTEDDYNDFGTATETSGALDRIELGALSSPVRYSSTDGYTMSDEEDILDSDLRRGEQTVPSAPKAPLSIVNESDAAAAQTAEEAVTIDSAQTGDDQVIDAESEPKLNSAEHVSTYSATLHLMDNQKTSGASDAQSSSNTQGANTMQSALESLPPTGSSSNKSQNIRSDTEAEIFKKSLTPNLAELVKPPPLPHKYRKPAMTDIQTRDSGERAFSPPASDYQSLQPSEDIALAVRTDLIADDISRSSSSGSDSPIIEEVIEQGHPLELECDGVVDFVPAEDIRFGLPDPTAGDYPSVEETSSSSDVPSCREYTIAPSGTDEHLVGSEFESQVYNSSFENLRTKRVVLPSPEEDYGCASTNAVVDPLENSDPEQFFRSLYMGQSTGEDASSPAGLSQMWRNHVDPDAPRPRVSIDIPIERQTSDVLMPVIGRSAPAQTERHIPIGQWLDEIAASPLESQTYDELSDGFENSDSSRSVSARTGSTSGETELRFDETPGSRADSFLDDDPDSPHEKIDNLPDKLKEIAEIQKVVFDSQDDDDDDASNSQSQAPQWASFAHFPTVPLSLSSQSNVKTKSSTPSSSSSSSSSRMDTVGSDAPFNIPEVIERDTSESVNRTSEISTANTTVEQTPSESCHQPFIEDFFGSGSPSNDLPLDIGNDNPSPAAEMARSHSTHQNVIAYPPESQCEPLTFSYDERLVTEPTQITSPSLMRDITELATDRNCVKHAKPICESLSSLERARINPGTIGDDSEASKTLVSIFSGVSHSAMALAPAASFSGTQILASADTDVTLLSSSQILPLCAASSSSCTPVLPSAPVSLSSGASLSALSEAPITESSGASRSASSVGQNSAFRDAPTLPSYKTPASTSSEAAEPPTTDGIQGSDLGECPPAETQATSSSKALLSASSRTPLSSAPLSDAMQSAHSSQESVSVTSAVAGDAREKRSEEDIVSDASVDADGVEKGGVSEGNISIDSESNDGLKVMIIESRERASSGDANHLEQTSAEEFLSDEPKAEESNSSEAHSDNQSPVTSASSPHSSAFQTPRGSPSCFTNSASWDLQKSNPDILIDTSEPVQKVGSMARFVDLLSRAIVLRVPDDVSSSNSMEIVQTPYASPMSYKLSDQCIEVEEPCDTDSAEITRPARTMSVDHSNPLSDIRDVQNSEPSDDEGAGELDEAGDDLVVVLEARHSSNKEDSHVTPSDSVEYYASARGPQDEVLSCDLLNSLDVGSCVSSHRTQEILSNLIPHPSMYSMPPPLAPNNISPTRQLPQEHVQDVCSESSPLADEPLTSLVLDDSVSNSPREPLSASRCRNNSPLPTRERDKHSLLRHRSPSGSLTRLGHIFLTEELTLRHNSPEELAAHGAAKYGPTSGLRPESTDSQPHGDGRAEKKSDALISISDDEESSFFLSSSDDQGPLAGAKGEICQQQSTCVIESLPEIVPNLLVDSSVEPAKKVSVTLISSGSSQDKADGHQDEPPPMSQIPMTSNEPGEECDSRHCTDCGQTREEGDEEIEGMLSEIYSPKPAEPSMVPSLALEHCAIVGSEGSVSPDCISYQVESGAESLAFPVSESAVDSRSVEAFSEVSGDRTEVMEFSLPQRPVQRASLVGVFPSAQEVGLHYADSDFGQFAAVIRPVEVRQTPPLMPIRQIRASPKFENEVLEAQYEYHPSLHGVSPRGRVPSRPVARFMQTLQGPNARVHATTPPFRNKLSHARSMTDNRRQIFSVREWSPRNTQSASRLGEDANSEKVVVEKATSTTLLAPEEEGSSWQLKCSATQTEDDLPESPNLDPMEWIIKESVRPTSSSASCEDGDHGYLRMSSDWPSHQKLDYRLGRSQTASSGLSWKAPPTRLASIATPKSSESLGPNMNFDDLVTPIDSEVDREDVDLRGRSEAGGESSAQETSCMSHLDERRESFEAKHDAHMSVPEPWRRRCVSRLVCVANSKLVYSNPVANDDSGFVKALDGRPGAQLCANVNIPATQGEKQPVVHAGGKNIRSIVNEAITECVFRPAINRRATASACGVTGVDGKGACTRFIQVKYKNG